MTKSCAAGSAQGNRKQAVTGRDLFLNKHAEVSLTRARIGNEGTLNK